MIVTDGVEIIISEIKDVFTTMRVGTGTTAASLADSALVTSVVSKSVSNDDSVAGQIVYSGELTVTEGNGNSLTECCLENASAKILCRRVHSAISKTSSFQLDYSFTIKVESV